MTLHPFVVGCDISKRHIDIHHSGDGTMCRIANTDQAITAWIDALTDTTGLVVMEATGRYDTVLRHALGKAGIPHARVNPEQARHFARATGRKAKTDAIDARMLAELGQRLPLRIEPPAQPARLRLAACSRRRDQLVAMRKQERTRRAEETDPLIAADLDEHLAQLDQRIATFDRIIAETMRSDPALARQAALLRSAPGIGPVTATVLIAHMPELGCIPARATAALAGLAPYNNDSGSFRGKRSVRGGRVRIRQALYMAALAAARSDTILGRFHQHLRDAGKPPKVALIALARKLLTTLNAIVRQQIPFQQNAS
jgi:transposase